MASEKHLWACVGLGNMGVRYEGTRHNVGAMFVKHIAEFWSASAFIPKGKTRMALGKINETSVVFLLPETFMNISGQAFAPVLSFLKIPCERTIVFHDDLDLACGDIRLKQGGGNAGHNGLKSLDAHIGNAYWRLRIGIGRPIYKGMVSTFVLSAPEEEEQALLSTRATRVSQHLPLFFQKGAPAFLQQLASVERAAIETNLK